MRQMIGIIVGVMFAAALAARGEAVRADLGLRNVYWQVLPSDVRAVKVDRKGRRGSRLDGTDTVDQLKAEVEARGGDERAMAQVGKDPAVRFQRPDLADRRGGTAAGLRPLFETVDRATGHPQQSRWASGRGSTRDLRSGD